MKKILQFVLIYLIVIGSIFSLYFTTNQRTQTELSFTQGELSGLDYLRHIHKLTMSLALYKESLESNHDKSTQSQLKKKMQNDIDTLYLKLKEYPEFKNKDLHDKLSRLSKGEFEVDEYYTFLDDINHENYRIGDISRLLFEEDREAYFLSSLTTHYMPEFIISLLIVHNKVEEFMNTGSLSEGQKQLYTEQNKLIYLSSKELEGIIKLLRPNNQTHQLSTLMSKIQETLFTLQTYTYDLNQWKNNKIELQKYISTSYQVISLAQELNDAHVNILENRLSQREEGLQEKILTNKFSLIFLSLFITFLAYYFYKSHLSNLNKDKEIKKISKALDKSVIYSRTDKHGNITHVSTALCKLSGYTKKELIGKTHRVFRDPDVSNEFFKNLWSTILQKKTWTGEFKNIRKDKSSYWVKLIVSPDLDEDGEILGFDAYREEISDKKALEEEKQKTQEALEFKSMFLSNMSHEIRTPLNGIIGFTQLALQSELTPKDHQLIEKIESASELLLGVINDILDISKIESGKMHIEKAVFNLQDSIETVKNLLSFKAEEKGITLEVEYINVEDFTVKGDSLRFIQILTNLVSNAVKFTSKGGVVIRLKQLPEQRYLCEVIDTGIGLKEEQKTRLFQEFAQADMSTSRKYGGTGLGLAISKKLVELMNGEISVTSSFAVGSTFSFTLPLAKASNEPRPQQLVNKENPEGIQEELNALKGKHLLVAEDNKMNQMLLEMLLEKTSIILDFAEDGQIAIAKFKENNYDLILMDIQMPNVNGYQATQEIRTFDKKIPILALSANVMAEDIAKALDAGMNDHLAKPIELEKLNALLLKYLKV